MVELLQPAPNASTNPAETLWDALAGADDRWAEEDFLRSPDRDDFLGFFRGLLVALAASLLVWLALGGAALQAYQLISG